MSDWGWHWGPGGAYHQAIAAEEARRNRAPASHGQPVRSAPAAVSATCSCGSAATHHCGRCGTGCCDEHVRFYEHTLLCLACGAGEAKGHDTIEDMLRARFGTPPGGRSWTQKF